MTRGEIISFEDIYDKMERGRRDDRIGNDRREKETTRA